jgi:hypothetical protein
LAGHQRGLARAVFFNRLGEMRDRSFENQRYRASGLTLLTAAIVLWNTVYLERAVEALKDRGFIVDDSLLQHLSPLGWEHINLTRDYVWPRGQRYKFGKFRAFAAVYAAIACFIFRFVMRPLVRPLFLFLCSCAFRGRCQKDDQTETFPLVRGFTLACIVNNASGPTPIISKPTAKSR